MKRRFPDPAPSMQDDLNRFVSWLHSARPEMVLSATVESVSRIYRTNPRVLEAKLLARQDQIRRQSNARS